MIFITFDPDPVSTSPQVLAGYRVEAYVREFPIGGPAGAWSLTDAQSADISPRRLRIQAGEGRYQIAIRFVKTLDESVEPEYADTGAPELWPEGSRQFVTCGVGLTEDDIPTITASPWRRVSSTNSQIPLTITNHEVLNATVIQWRVKGDGPWLIADTLLAGVDTFNFDIATSGGTPDGLGTMGNLLEFRCYQLSGTAEEGPTSAVIESFAGVAPAAGVVVSDLGSDWGVEWEQPDAQAGAAEATQPSLRITPLAYSGNTAIDESFSYGRATISATIPKYGLSPQRFQFQHAVGWTDPSWPADYSPVVIVAGFSAVSADSVRAPAFDDPFVVPLFNGQNIVVIATIGAANNGAVELEKRIASTVTGATIGWVSEGAKAVSAQGAQVVFFVENEPGEMILAVRARHTMTVDAVTTYSEWVIASLPGFPPTLDE